MVLVEDMVSRKHAKIITDDRGVLIQDLGSTNGTFVNGEKIRKVDLKDGDRILIGTSIIKIVAVTGWGQEADKQKSRAAGIDVHLMKPVDAAELRIALADNATLH